MFHHLVVTVNAEAVTTHVVTALCIIVTLRRPPR